MLNEMAEHSTFVEEGAAVCGVNCANRLSLHTTVENVSSLPRHIWEGQMKRHIDDGWSQCKSCGEYTDTTVDEVYVDEKGREFCSYKCFEEYRSPRLALRVNGKLIFVITRH